MWNTTLKKRLSRKVRTDGHKTEVDEGKKDFPTSPSCTSSAITVSEEPNVEKGLTDQEPGKKGPNEKFDGLKEKYKHPTNEEAQEIELSDSPISSHSSNIFSSSQDNETIDVPPEAIVDFCEVLDCLNDDGDKNTINHQNPLDKFEGDDDLECSKWLRFFENELGLSSESNVQQCQEMYLEPEVSSPDYFPIWHGLL